MERPFEGVILHRGGMSRAIEQRRDYFVPAGITPNADPMETVMMVEYQIGPSRLEGLGILYSYPAHAVKFFVDAARSQERNGQFIQRRFIGAPTFARAERGVVYAVAQDHEENLADRQFRSTLDSLLAAYRARRDRFIGEGKTGVIALLRDWFCDPAPNHCGVPRY